MQGFMLTEMDISELSDLCWTAVTLSCVLIKLIAQFLGYCYGIVLVGQVTFCTILMFTPVYEMAYFWNVCVCED